MQESCKKTDISLASARYVQDFCKKSGILHQIFVQDSCKFLHILAGQIYLGWKVTLVKGLEGDRGRDRVPTVPPFKIISRMSTPEKVVSRKNIFFKILQASWQTGLWGQ